MRVLLLLLLLSFWKPADAQRSYFLYLESEGGQPFYVRMEDRIFSSSNPGYLVLPEMADSTYQLFIGFSNGRRATKFSIPMTARDRGLLLRQEEGHIRLSDLQSNALLAPIPDPLADVNYTVRTDPFTVLLSRAAQDTDILYVPVPQAAVVKKEAPLPQPVSETPLTNPDTVKTVAEPVTTQMVPTVRDSAAISPVDSQAVVTAPPNLQTDTGSGNALLLTRDSTSVLTRDSVALLVSVPGGQDSIAKVSDSVVIVPPSITSDSSMVQQPASGDSLVAQAPAADSVQLPLTSAVDSSATLAAGPEYRKTNVRKYGESSTSEGFGLVYIDETPGGADTIRLIIPNPPFNLGVPDSVKKDDPVLFLERPRDTVQIDPVPVSLSLSKPKADCPAQATDNDFFRLRKSMAGRTSDEEMIEDARKYFRKMCFSTEQVRNLSVLFLTAAGKYGFFDAAYLHVSDQQQFATLESEIRDPYYAKRFKALIGD